HLSLIVYLFFLITPPPPLSSLFPYTTLFRSRFIEEFSCIMIQLIHLVNKAGKLFFICFFQIISLFQIFYFLLCCRKIIHKLFYSDRKSTRLNSSHVSISYAVFCLKKKNKYII